MSHHRAHIIIHLVFATKRRQPWLYRPVRPRLFGYLAASLRHERALPIEIGGVDDHVHLLFQMPPTRALSPLVGRVKSNSSRWLNQRIFLDFQFAWQTGFGVFSVSPRAVPAVRRYIRNQEAHHHTISFSQEMARLSGQLDGV